MPEAKTRATDASVDDFLNSLENDDLRWDCLTIAEIMRQATESKPRMWGANIVGFGSHRLKYATGREVDWPLIALSPRKQNIALYLSPGFDGRDELLAILGKHSCGKSCVYIKRLSDVHLPTLRKLVTASVRHASKLQTKAS
jgi:hypothetical protein